MRFGSLFSGIGGIDLGLERAGMKCIWQVEIEGYCRQILAKHWPKVRRCRDVCAFPPKPVSNWVCDLICGGFPCQDLSCAGKRKGIQKGTRSGLWFEFYRIIGLLRPKYVLVENVPGILSGGLGIVLKDLSSLGYDAEWDAIPAAAFGAFHIRDRIFILAYNDRQFQRRGTHNGLGRKQCEKGIEKTPTFPDRQGLAVREGRTQDTAKAESSVKRSDLHTVHDSYLRRCGTPKETVFAGRGGIELSDWSAGEPDMGGMVHGIPHRVDRIKGLGNAVVPQVAEWIGRRILENDS